MNTEKGAWKHEPGNHNNCLDCLDIEEKRVRKDEREAIIVALKMKLAGSNGRRAEAVIRGMHE